MPPERPELRLVDPATGELSPDAPQTFEAALVEIDRLRDQLVGAENNVRSMRSQMAAMKRETDEIDRGHSLFPAATALFRYWQERCDHPRVGFTAEHMRVVLPRIKHNGVEECRRAIRGAEYDAFVTTRKNGTRHRHDDWFQIFHPQKFRSFVDRAPDPGPPSEAQGVLIGSAREFALDLIERVEERSKLVREGRDPVAISHLLLELNRRLVAWTRTPFASDRSARVTEQSPKEAEDG